MKQIFKDYKSLSRAIHKQDFKSIKGLKAEITEEDFNYFLNVLPPMDWLENSFILSECLTENLYYKFSKVDNKFYCEVVEYEPSEDFL